MDIPESIQVKLISTPDVIDELERDWGTHPNQVEIVSTGPEENSTAYRFGLVEAAAIVAIVQGAFYLGELSTRLYRWHQDNKDKNRKIVIQTPLGRTEFVSTSNMTESQVQDALKQLAGVDI